MMTPMNQKTLDQKQTGIVSMDGTGCRNVPPAVLAGNTMMLRLALSAMEKEELIIHE
jgi:hypothetical protein